MGFNYKREGEDVIPSNKKWQFKVKVGGHPIGTVKIEPDKVEPTYFERWIPKPAYQSGKLDISIEKMKGDYAVCSEIFLYEYQKTSGKEGTQFANGSDNFSLRIQFIEPKPNPFNNSTKIGFVIPAKEKVSLKIYDVSGRLCKTIVNKELSPGTYSYNWDGKGSACGIYFSVFNVGENQIVKKMIKIR